MSKPIADLHCHTGLKPAFNDKVSDLWVHHSNSHPEEFLPFFNLFRLAALNKQQKELATETQSNLNNCVKGNVGLIGFTIYPIERQYASRKNGYLGFLSVMTLFLFKKGMVRIFKRKRELYILLMEVFVGISRGTVLKLWDQQKNRKQGRANYFEDYKKELQVFIDEHNKELVDGQKSLRLIQNYTEYEMYKDHDSIICGFITVEGLHSFGNYNLKDLFRKRDINSISVIHKNELLQSFEDNLWSIKTSKFCPFFITLSHHFNNLLIGHAKSFGFPMSLFFRQKRGSNRGITPQGVKILEILLSKENGKRILFDIKHLSVKSRIQFYEIIKKKNQDFGVGNDFKKIPIICSHGAVNGRKTLRETLAIKIKNMINKKSYVSRWDVNLSDEDILEIRDSNGLIGVLMHEGRMPGKVFDKRMKKIYKSNRSDEEKSRQQKLLYIQLFLTNVYHIVQVTYNSPNQHSEFKGWDVICLGTDNDGIVNPFDTYKDSSFLTEFKNDIIDYLTNYISHLQNGYGIIDLVKNTKGKDNISEINFKKLNGPLSVEDVVDRIFLDNMERFLKTYYTEEYLTVN